MSVRTRKRTPSRKKLARLTILVLAACAVWFFQGREALLGPGHKRDLSSGMVTVEASAVRVIDGDTFETGGQRIRILGIDTPELANPAHGFPVAQPYSEEAARYARALVDSASEVSYLPYRNDRYGRLLAHVFVDGELFGEKMVLAGLAWETVSIYGDNGFPELAARITRAARRTGRPPFEEPWIWRREQRGRGRPLSFLRSILTPAA